MNIFKLGSTPPLILYPQMEHCWNHLETMHMEHTQTGNGSNCQILGVSGVGKSTLLTNFEKAHPTRSGDAGVVKPVVRFQIPSAPSPRSVMGAIVEAFGGADVGTASALMKRAVRYIEHFDVGVLLADEVHHLIDRGRMKTHAHLGDCWKEFNDQISSCIVLAGAPRLVQLFETNNQLRNRAGENLVLRPFSYDNFEEPLGKFILCATREGPLCKHHAFLTSSDVLTRIQFATDGVQANIVRFTQELTKVVGDSKDLDLHCMDKAWRVLGSADLPAARRPFDRHFNFERLCGLGEPFYPSPFDGDNHAPYF